MGIKNLVVTGAVLAAVGMGFAQTKIACVGNSITEGFGIWDKKKYPEHLQDILGSQYEVKNFGHSSQMFRKNSDESYWKSAKFTAAYEYAPDIVVIELGTNDSKYFFDGKGSSSGYNYKYDPSVKSELLPDYEALIDTFANQSQKPTIYATLQPYAQNVEWGIVDTAIVNVINPIIKEAATNKGVKLIDLHSTFNNPEWLLDDVVHPNEQGAEELAKIIAGAIKGGQTDFAGSSSSVVAESSSSETALESSSSSSEAATSSSSAQVEGFATAAPAFRTNSQITVVGTAIQLTRFAGKVEVFDLNGNLIRQTVANGFAQIQLEHPGAYIVRAGNHAQKVNLK